MSRLPPQSSRVDSSGNRTQTQVQVHRERFTGNSAGPALVTQLNRMADSLAKATEAARSNPRSSEVTFEDVHLFGTVTLKHGLGRRVRWSVVRWQSAAGGVAPIVEERADSQNDSNTLLLHSSVNGTADVAVWAQQ